jgi:mono/diheme cytochrome c family protein
MKQVPNLVLAAAIAAAFCGALYAAPPSPAGDPANGRKVYEYWCATCHGRGAGHPGTQSLEVKYRGKVPAALEDRTDLSPPVTANFVRRGFALMPPFRKTEISDAELRDLAAYLARNRK